MWYPIDTETGAINSDGVWEVDFGGYNTARVVEWISLVGPVSSTCNVYLDTVFVDTTARGDFNRADYYSGIPLAQGRQLRLVWNVATGAAPVASLGMSDGTVTVSTAANIGQISVQG